jgi:nitrate/TMAO reductase-like tetraheme cytochrome c subunit
MRTFTLYLLTLGLGFTLYSCASSIPRSDAVHQAWAEKEWHNIHLDEARDLYAANCSGCHSLHAPGEHTQAEWIKLFDEMAGRAHMTPSDSVSVLAYLVTYSRNNDLAD